MAPPFKDTTLSYYTAMKKRNLFDELMEGVDALKSEREGKITLKRLNLQQLEAPEMKPDEILRLREIRHFSRPVFAHAIPTNQRPEQAKPPCRFAYEIG